MRILAISDFDLKGSGYKNIIVPLCDGLTERGHEIKAAGLHYMGEEHFHKFSIIPAKSAEEIAAIVLNLEKLWTYDVLMVALDIHLQGDLIKNLNLTEKPYKYLGIFPIEADPIDFKSSAIIMQMDKAFCISEFGRQEIAKLHLDVEHLVIGLDCESWRQPSQEEREGIRNAYGIPQDEFVVLTVADNQERKNLATSLKAFADFNKEVPNSRYVLVTRVDFFAGWSLDELANRLGIADKLMLVERGIGFKELWSFYSMSDVFLLLSKAEGLGMPILEAMAVGLPVVGTNCSAFVEHLSDGRGFLVDYLDDLKFGFPPVDPFRLQNRYWASCEHATRILLGIYEGRYKHKKDKALEYVCSKKWENTILQVDGALRELGDD